MVTKDFEELFACLNARGVKDIDVFVDSAPENIRPLLLALTDFGFGDVA